MLCRTIFTCGLAIAAAAAAAPGNPARRSTADLLATLPTADKAKVQGALPEACRALLGRDNFGCPAADDTTQEQQQKQQQQQCIATVLSTCQADPQALLATAKAYLAAAAADEQKNNPEEAKKKKEAYRAQLGRLILFVAGALQGRLGSEDVLAQGKALAGLVEDSPPLREFSGLTTTPRGKELLYVFDDDGEGGGKRERRGAEAEAEAEAEAGTAEPTTTTTTTTKRELARASRQRGAPRSETRLAARAVGISDVLAVVTGLLASLIVPLLTVIFGGIWLHCTSSGDKVLDIFKPNRQFDAHDCP